MQNQNIFKMIEKRTKQNPIISKTIELFLHISGPEVRQEVQRLRREGCPIASCGDGYYLARTPGELEETLADLRSRSMSMLKTISALETRLKEFKGQEVLPI